MSQTTTSNPNTSVPSTETTQLTTPNITTTVPKPETTFDLSTNNITNNITDQSEASKAS